MARYIRISFVAFLAGAYRAVVLHEASGIRAAIARIATQTVYASLFARAIVVGGTAWRYWDYDCMAFAVFVVHPAFRTRADHRADRKRV